MADIKKLRLARLPSNWREQPQLIERYWDEAMSAIEKTLNAIIAIPEIQAALDGLDQTVQQAQTAAVNAQTAADNAQAAADNATQVSSDQARETSLVNSYVTNFTGDLIVADATGNLTIAAHDRVYGDSTLNPTVRVNGGTLSTSATPGQVVRVYYSDPSRSGGSVTYRFTIDPASPMPQTGNTHSVGAVAIPQTGTQKGKNITPPGYVDY